MGPRQGYDPQRGEWLTTLSGRSIGRAPRMDDRTDGSFPLAPSAPEPWRERTNIYQMVIRFLVFFFWAGSNDPIFLMCPAGKAAARSRMQGQEPRRAAGNGAVSRFSHGDTGSRSRPIRMPDPVRGRAVREWFLPYTRRRPAGSVEPGWICAARSGNPFWFNV